MAQSPLVQAVTAELAKYPGLDAKAVLAIAGHEGLSGGVGDHGTSFGPFQLHAGGALPHGIANPGKWAWSPQGIDYALNAINKAAGGLHGAQAIQAISTKFERPANPAAEIADAERRYGLPVGGSPINAALPKLGGGGAGLPPIRPQGPSPVLSALRLLGFNAPGGFGQAHPVAPRAPLAPLAAPQPPAGGAPTGPLSLANVGSIQVDSRVAPTVAAIIKQFGVTPTSGYRSAEHNAQVGGAGNSDHLRGDAVDFSGSPQALQALYRYAQTRFPYVEPMAQAKDHVHISFRRP